MAKPSERKSFSRPDETREFPHGRAEILNIGDGVVGRLVFQPGWRGSEHVKPLAGTQLVRATTDGRSEQEVLR